MIIRKAELKDAVECERLSNISEFKMPNGDVPDADSFKKSIDKIFFVAEDNNKVIGLILGYKLIDDFVYLDLFTVDSNYRGKNIGQKLLFRFRDELKKQFVKQYFLIAPTHNEKTLNFYRKNGLTEGKQYTLFCEDM